jgi:tetratricopeptide (TPR) repeat protein
MAGWTAPAAAQSDPQWDICQGEDPRDPQTTIDACRASLSQMYTDNLRADAYNNLGVAYGHNGQSDKAISSFSEAIRAVRGHSEPEYHELADMIRLNRAKAYDVIGDYDSAIADYDVLLRSKPDSSIYIAGRAWAQKALDRKKSGQPAEPIGAEQPSGGSGTALFATALGDEKANHYDNAIAEFSQVIDHDPAYAEAYEHRCKLYTFTGKFEAALVDCNRAVDLGVDKIAAHGLRADLYAAMGRYSDAVPDFDEIIRLQPDWNMGYALRCQLRALGNRELDAARKDCDAFERRGGKSVLAFESLALIDYRVAGYANAIDEANKSLALGSKRAAALYLRGLARQKSGDAAGGTADIAEAKAINPKIAEIYAGYGVTP